MVVIHDENLKVNTWSLITHCRQPKRRQLSPEFIPYDIWLEILSRLPIKSLFKSRSVCKLWRNIFFPLYRTIDTHPLNVPLCGLLLISADPYADTIETLYWFSYFCLRNQHNYIIREDCFENNLIYSSGFESGLLSDLSFDFSILRKVLRETSEWEFISFVLHGGLLLLTSKDNCTSQVHNPTTKQIYFVPKSRMVNKYGFRRHKIGENPGLIIQLPSSSTDQKCRFMVVRFCFRMKLMEVYYSESRRWRKYRLKMDDEFLSSTNLHLQHYAGFTERGVLSLYLLTDKCSGIAIKFKGHINSEMKQYCFALPEVIRQEYYHARLWECEETLYLSFYMKTGVWIWKAGSTEINTWSWLPVLEISPTRLVCMPVARKQLSKVVLDVYIRVIPLACHPDFPILYLSVKSSVFAYHMKTDTLDKIGELKDFDHRTFDNLHTFKPCYSFMDNDGLMDHNSQVKTKEEQLVADL